MVVVPFRMKVDPFGDRSSLFRVIKQISAKKGTKPIIPFVSLMLAEIRPMVLHYGDTGVRSLDIQIGSELIFLLNFRASRSQAIEYQRLFEFSGYPCKLPISGPGPASFEGAYAFAEAYSLMLFLRKHLTDVSVSFFKSSEDGIFIIDTILTVKYSRASED